MSNEEEDNEGDDYHEIIKKRFFAAIKKAEEGDTHNMWLLADFYSEGEYLPKDYIAAQAWLRKAAELGDDEAYKQLAKLLSKGNGIAKNLEEAFNINYELMFDCDAEAMMEVGVALKEGIGVPKDEKLGSMYMKHAVDIQLDLMKEDKENS